MLIESPPLHLLVGDALDCLREVPTASVNTCITSPPYYGLRDYGVDGQIGQEKTPDEYVARLVEVFREVRRVLVDDGSLWLNLGDSYSGSWGNYSGQKRGNGIQREITNGSRVPNPAYDANFARPVSSHKIEGLKPKDLIGIPWLVAFALRADGWYLRSDIIWAKPAPMPESVRDRPTRSHEHIFLLTKNAKYFYNWQDARCAMSPQWIAAVSSSSVYRYGGNNKWEHSENRGLASGKAATLGDGLANWRDVWRIQGEGFADAHFAVMPAEIVKRCIIAGCPPAGTVLDPFAGSGTTLKVAIEMGRKAIGIELNPQYAEMIEKRTLCQIGLAI
jgi:DNA modification methylase